MFQGDTSEEYRGVEGIGGWRRWAEIHVAGWGTKVEVAARAPRLMELMVEGSEAEKILSALTLKDLQAEDGVEKTFDLVYIYIYICLYIYH